MKYYAICAGFFLDGEIAKDQWQSIREDFLTAIIQNERVVRDGVAEHAAPVYMYWDEMQWLRDFITEQDLRYAALVYHCLGCYVVQVYHLN